MIEAFRIELTNMPGMPGSVQRLFSINYKAHGVWRQYNTPVLLPQAHWESELEHVMRYALEEIKTMEQRYAQDLGEC